MAFVIKSNKRQKIAPSTIAAFASDDEEPEAPPPARVTATSGQLPASSVPPDPSQPLAASTEQGDIVDAERFKVHLVQMQVQQSAIYGLPLRCSLCCDTATHDCIA